MHQQILIIDDEDKIRTLLARIIELEGYKTFQAPDCQTATKLLKKQSFDVVLCDVFLPDGNGVDYVLEIKKNCPMTEVILLTAHGNISDGVQAIKNGAFDYITKGNDNNKIIPTINRAMEQIAKAKGEAEEQSNSVDTHGFMSILGQSVAIKQAISLAKKVAETDAAILLTGETGTGKEIFAQAIHQASKRKDYPIVPINCSAFSKDLLESELFGYKAGAFTGALKDKKGLFEVANHGTIFLDEIGEMAYELQARLLRVLETGEYIKVGDTKPTKVDVRIISATNRDLQQEIAKGAFREDLFFRLSVFQIQLPPLRQRKDDIKILAEHFLQFFSCKLNKPVKGMTSDFLDALCAADWKGNVRQLRNVIERSVIVCDEQLTRQDLPIELQCGTYTNGQISETDTFELALIEKKHIISVLQYTKGNKTEAARLLKIGLATLYRKIESYGIIA